MTTEEVETLTAAINAAGIITDAQAEKLSTAQAVSLNGIGRPELEEGK